MSSGQHIAIAGAGPVGAVAALALQQRGFAVTIIDRIKPMPGPHGLGMDIRNVALSRGSRQLIESLITWPQQAGMFKTMHVWEQWGVNALNFDAAELGSDCLGWIAEVAPLLQALWQQLEANADIRVVLGDIQAVETDATGVMVTVAEETLHADFLFAADGARSAVRNLLEVATDIWPTGQSALTTVVETEHSHEHTAWQRFLVDGPLAFLPSKHEHYSSVVWSQSPASLETNLGLADDEFSHRVGAALENRLGRIVQVAQRLSFPLQQQLARSAQPRLAQKIVFRPKVPVKDAQMQGNQWAVAVAPCCCCRCNIPACTPACARVRTRQWRPGARPRQSDMLVAPHRHQRALDRCSAMAFFAAPSDHAVWI